MLSIKGKLRQDDSGHWYAVPSDKVETYDRLVRQIDDTPYGTDNWYDFVNRFEDLFRKYRLDGNLYDLDVILPE